MNTNIYTFSTIIINDFREAALINEM